MAARSSCGSASAEGGFTLLELLIAMSITVMLTGAVGAALVLGLRTSTQAGEQLNEAAWGQILTTWFLTDVHSAESHAESAACDPAGGDAVASFSWTDLGTEDARHADWWLDDGELSRATCAADGAWSEQPILLALGVESAEIGCANGSGAACTLTWVVLSTGDRNEPSRTYGVTATRRVSP